MSQKRDDLSTATGQVNRLSKHYAGIIGPEYKMLFGQTTRGFNVRMLKDLIDYIIGEHPNPKYPPKISEVREYVNSEIRKKYFERGQEQEWKRTFREMDKNSSKGEKLDYGGHDNVLDFLAAKVKSVKGGQR